MPTMDVDVLFFAAARDLAGVGALRLHLPSTATLAEAIEHVAARLPGLGPGLPSMRFAVNEEFAGPDHRLQAGDQIAFLPPVSGG
jgi:molybdopterin converting factor subunit 1